MIKITNLNKYYNKGKSNEIHVINNTNLELPDKGLISFLGPSGSGKTTLLSVIGGLESANGVIQYDDIIMKNYSVSKIDKYRKEHIGYIFQNYMLGIFWRYLLKIACIRFMAYTKIFAVLSDGHSI